MSIFADASALIRTVEAHLVQGKLSGFLPYAYFQRLIVFPAKFLRLGVRERTRDTTVLGMLSLVLLVLSAWLIGRAGVIGTNIASSFIIVSVVAPAIICVFAMPSMYGDSGVSEPTVQFVAEFLRSRGLNSASVDLLKKSVKPFEDRARSRVTALKWLVGLLWAGFLYTYTKGIEQAMTNPAALLPTVFISAAILLGVLVSFVCVWGYEASIDKLFRAIEFGCNDFCHLEELLSKQEVPGDA